MKCKSAVIGFSYLAGLICASFLLWQISIALCGVLVIAGALLFLAKKHTVGTSLFVIGLAAGVYSLYTVVAYNPVIEMDGQTVEITGTVSSADFYSADSASYEISTVINGTDTTIHLYNSDINLSCGDTLSFKARLSSFTDNTNFAEESYYKSKGIFLRAYAENEVSVTKGGFNIKKAINNFSDYIGERISLYLPDDEGSLIKAFFLGDKSDLSDELQSAVKHSGISHFAAVSGQHLSIIAHIIMLLLGLTPLKSYRKTGFFLLAGLILCFMMFFRMSPSVVRSGIMLIIFYGGKPLMRKSNTLNSMGLAALIIVLFNPYACLDTGFLLSLAGTFGIGVAAPAICRHIPESPVKPVLDAIAGTFAATLTTFPLASLFFGGISTVGIFTSTVLAFLFVPLLLCMMLFTMFGGNGEVFMFIAGQCAKLSKLVISFFGELKYSYISLDYSFIAPLTVFAVIFIAMVHLVLKKSSRTAMAVGVSVCLLVSAVTVWQCEHRDSTFITLYSDGNDACVFIRNCDASVVIASDDSVKIANRIEQYRKENFIDEFSVICLLESGNNNEEAIKSIPSQITVSADRQDISCKAGELMLCKYESYAMIDYMEKTICVSKVSQPVNADISVFYGYKKVLPDVCSAYRFYSSKRIKTNLPNQVNFYYTNADYIIDINGNITPR